MRLYAPESYRRATALERARYCNGCGGAATGWLSWLVAWLIPDTKKRSDLMFLFNLAILCSAGSRWLLLPRLFRCVAFYFAVVLFGRRFYGRKIAANVRRRSR